MRIDVTLWYRLITKGVITPNCYDGNSTISSTMPTSPTPSHYIQYDTAPPDGVRLNESGVFTSTNPPYSQYDDVNINQSWEKRFREGEGTALSRLIKHWILIILVFI